jgi:very-short-patch-repair endonuclease
METQVRRHGALAGLAARQHGVISHRQLAELGYSKGAVLNAETSGRLHRIHRGVYAVGHPGLSKRGRCLAAVLACGEGGLLSHESAAWLWGLLPECPEPPHVTVPARGHNRATVRIHHSTILDEHDRDACEGIPVTAVPRTLLDLAAGLPRRRLESTIERAERRALLEVDAIDFLIARSGRHPGRKRLRSALAIYRDPATTRSYAERAFVALVRRAGLPRPAINYFVAGHEIDAYWETERFAVEIDGYDTHGTRAAFERDPMRIEKLKLAGIDAIRITARRIEREPEGVATTLRTLLERHRRAVDHRQ